VMKLINSNHQKNNRERKQIDDRNMQTIFSNSCLCILLIILASDGALLAHAEESKAQAPTIVPVDQHVAPAQAPSRAPVIVDPEAIMVDLTVRKLQIAPPTQMPPKGATIGSISVNGQPIPVGGWQAEVAAAPGSGLVAAAVTQSEPSSLAGSGAGEPVLSEVQEPVEVQDPCILEATVGSEGGKGKGKGGKGDSRRRYARRTRRGRRGRQLDEDSDSDSEDELVIGGVLCPDGRSAVKTTIVTSKLEMQDEAAGSGANAVFLNVVATITASFALFIVW